MTVAQYGGMTNQDVRFRVKLKDPCLTATLVAPTNIATITVRDGATDYVEWTDATDDWSASQGDIDLCGIPNIVVLDSNNSVPSWITVSQPNPITAQDNWRINYAPYSPTGTAHQGASQPMILRITNPNYPNMGFAEKDFLVTVIAALCDCAALTWTVPSTTLTGYSELNRHDDFTFTLLPSVAPGAYDINPYLRQCQAEGFDCASGGGTW